MTLSLSRVASLLDDTYLHLILLPTEQCNFRCTYCYEDFEIGGMPSQVVSGVKQLLTSRAEAGLRRLDVSWFGGEPLLARSTILEIGEHASNLSKAFSIRYRSNMTTNGYMLNLRTLEELVSAGVTDFQISLDGWGQVHDKTRRRADGRGTFDRIWQNLLQMRQSEFEFQVSIRVHFSPDNVSSVRALVQAINRELQDNRFIVRFRPIEHLGGPNDRTFEIYDYRKARELQADLCQLLENQKQLSTDADEADYVCYASMPNSLLVRANGIVGKCTVALNDPRNVVGRLSPDGRLSMSQDRVKFWIRGLETQERQALACPLHAPTGNA